jgi:hypothetical protein
VLKVLKIDEPKLLPEWPLHVDAAQNSIEMDYLKIFEKSTAASFKGYVSTKYEGEKLGEEDVTRKQMPCSKRECSE